MGPSFFNRVELFSEKRILIINVLLEVYFICLRALEYYGTRFYAPTLFIATGFHRLDVLGDTLFLIVSLRCHKNMSLGISPLWIWGGHMIFILWICSLTFPM